MGTAGDHKIFRPRTGGKDEAKVSRFFADGKRLVDYVLAYEDVDDDEEASLAEVDFSQMLTEVRGIKDMESV